jgi:hypothetical protein
MRKRRGERRQVGDGKANASEPLTMCRDVAGFSLDFDGAVAAGGADELPY